VNHELKLFLSISKLRRNPRIISQHSGIDTFAVTIWQYEIICQLVDYDLAQK